MGQEIVDRLVAADLQPPRPRAFDRHFRRRNHEEHIDEITEPREQPGRLVSFRRRDETVETEAIDQKVRHLSPGGFARHVTIELLVDDFDLVPSHRAGIFVADA